MEIVPLNQSIFICFVLSTNKECFHHVLKILSWTLRTILCLVYEWNFLSGSYLKDSGGENRERINKDYSNSYKMTRKRQKIALANFTENLASVSSWLKLQLRIKSFGNVGKGKIKNIQKGNRRGSTRRTMIWDREKFMRAIYFFHFVI